MRRAPWRFAPRTVKTGRRGRLWLLLPITLVIAIYALIGSAARPGPWPTYMTYYDLQAEGFRSGHLYIPIQPAKQLLEASDPYDPSHSRYWLGDATLYKGHYYMYWGPVPGLLQAAAKSVLSIHRMIGDQYLVFVAFTLCAVFGGMLIDRVGRKLFDTVPGWFRALMILAFAFANPAPHLLATPGVYQAAIGFGQAFTLGGLVLAFDAVVSAPLHGGWRLLGAGAVWALAIGSRIGMLPVTAVLGLLTALACAWPESSRWRSFLRSLFAIAAPMAVGLGALLVYNKLRFDDWLEFGTNLQLSGFKFRLSKEYWLSNLYSYTLRPYFADCHFPYAVAPWFIGSRAFPDDAAVPSGYLINEPLVGWLRVVPLTWLLAALPFAIVQRFRVLRQRSAHSSPSPSPILPASGSRPRTFLWLSACLGVVAATSGLLVMGLYMATMRYLADVTNGLVLLGVLGAFWLFSRSKEPQVRLAIGLVSGALACLTLGFGLLLGFQGYTGHFKTHNPTLHAQMVSALSVCADGDTTPPVTNDPTHPPPAGR